MSENSQPPPEISRHKAVEAAGWTAGVTALFITWALGSNPTSWPVAIGAAAVAAMVAVVCYFMLKK